MGQKVHPTGVRVGIIKDWNSKWYANSNDFADYLVEDQKIRKFLKKKLYLAGISKIEIERTAKAIKVNLYTAKPGIVIGKGGAGVESVKAELTKLIGKDVNLNIVEVKNVDTDACRKYSRTIRKKNFIQKSYETMYAKNYEIRCFRNKNFSIWKIRWS